MANLGNFDPNAVEPATTIEPVPSGDYTAIITDSEMRETARGDGHYLELTHQIIEGEFKGRILWARLNLDNPSDKARSIAQQQLSAICHAAGIKQAITDSEVLHNKPLVIRAVYVPANVERGWSAKNDIKGWKASGATMAASAPAAAPRHQPPPQAAAAGSPPWASRA